MGCGQFFEKLAPAGHPYLHNVIHERPSPGEGPSPATALISQKVFVGSFCKSQFRHKLDNFFFVIVIIKDKLTDLCGNWLLKNDITNTFCEITPQRDDREDRVLVMLY